MSAKSSSLTFLHRFDVLLEPRGGSGGPKLVIRVNENRHSTGGGLAKDAGDIASIAFSRNTIYSCTQYKRYCYLLLTGGSSARTQSRVAAAESVAIERSTAIGCVAGASGVAKERMKTTGRVRAARRVAVERQTADSGVVRAGSVVCERTFTDSGIVISTVE